MHFSKLASDALALQRHAHAVASPPL